MVVCAEWLSFPNICRQSEWSDVNCFAAPSDLTDRSFDLCEFNEDPISSTNKLRSWLPKVLVRKYECTWTKKLTLLVLVIYLGVMCHVSLWPVWMNLYRELSLFISLNYWESAFNSERSKSAFHCKCDAPLNLRVMALYKFVLLTETRYTHFTTWIAVFVPV